MYRIENYFTSSQYFFQAYFKEITTCDYVYEFGVYGGKSMLDLMSDAHKVNKPVKNFFGFDTFTGLTETDGIMKDWYKGNFSSENLFGISPDKCAEKIQTIAKIFFPNTNTKIFCTKFSDIIFTNEFQPADFINIDCDLYSSTIDALNFMCINNLIKIGTVIRYDDMLVNQDKYTKGEGLAHIEMCKKYNIVCNQITDSGFRITKI